MKKGKRGIPTARAKVDRKGRVGKRGIGNGLLRGVCASSSPPERRYFQQEVLDLMGRGGSIDNIFLTVEMMNGRSWNYKCTTTYTILRFFDTSLQ